MLSIEKGVENYQNWFVPDVRVELFTGRSRQDNFQEWFQAKTVCDYRTLPSMIFFFKNLFYQKQYKYMLGTLG